MGDDQRAGCIGHVRLHRRQPPARQEGPLSGGLWPLLIFTSIYCIASATKCVHCTLTCCIIIECAPPATPVPTHTMSNPAASQAYADMRIQPTECVLRALCSWQAGYCAIFCGATSRFTMSSNRCPGATPQQSVSCTTCSGWSPRDRDCCMRTSGAVVLHVCLAVMSSTFAKGQTFLTCTGGASTAF